MHSAKSTPDQNAGSRWRPSKPSKRKLQMNCSDKLSPIASLPDNWSAFDDQEVLPWDLSGAEAAATLRRARSLRARGQATVSV